MADSKFPSIGLTVTPFFGPTSSQNDSSLSFHMILDPSFTFHADEILLTLPLERGRCPTQQYTKDDISLLDDNGELPFTVQNEGNICNWLPSRQTRGSIQVSYRAKPRLVDIYTQIAGRIDLRSDHGGMMGAGQSMILLPPASTFNPTSTLSVNWDLSSSPPGTRAVWTFGEGPDPVRKIGPLQLLVDSVYAVGPLKSYPSPSSSSSSSPNSEEGQYYGFYYFGNPPAIITAAGETNQRLFPKMSEFFSDPPSAENPYRVFVRDATPGRGNGGTAFVRSYMLEYDAAVVSAQPIDMLNLLSHEMVHNWPLMPEFTGEESLENGWYVEGVANYYQARLLHKANLITQTQYLEELNGELTAYYTNLGINLSLSEAGARSDNWVIATTPYVRGAIFLAVMNAKIRIASQGKRGIDEVVFELLRRRREGLIHDAKQFLDLVAAEIGDEEAKNDYHAMRAGHTIRFPEGEIVLEGHKLVRRDQEMYELGFETRSLNLRVVVGLVDGSRAMSAGLREGDVIVRTSIIPDSSARFDAAVEVVVRRGEEEVVIAYWPRAWRKVESYQLIREER